MKPIYKPKGRAKEYGDYAINIYTGCPHRCYYCFAPNVLRRDREEFHSHVEPRPGIVEAVKRQLDKEQITGELIHLCFTCDPYPVGYDTTATREIIKAIKDSGNHVQILTKGGREPIRDFDLLDCDDWFGITYTGNIITCNIFEPVEWEPNAAATAGRLYALDTAHELGIRTWMSMEPVIDQKSILRYLSLNVKYVDYYKIGKLNYHPSDIDWAAFGKEAEKICIERGLDYTIKDDLRREMEQENAK